MYPNLIKALKEKHIKREEVAELLSISQSTLSCKINGKSDFRVYETKLIKETYFPELKIDFLFSTVI